MSHTNFEIYRKPLTGYFKFIFTICPRSSDTIYIVCYYIKWVPTSWEHSTYTRLLHIAKNQNKCGRNISESFSTVYSIVQIQSCPISIVYSLYRNGQDFLDFCIWLLFGVSFSSLLFNSDVDKLSVLFILHFCLKNKATCIQQKNCIGEWEW